MDFSDIPITKDKAEGKTLEPLTFEDIPIAQRDYASEIPSGAELTQIGRENTPAWTEAPSQAVSELVGGMVPHDLPSYFESVFPPAAAARLGTRLAQGDVSGIPFAGRVPELIAAEETPAFSKERYLAGMKTLMDVGLLTGIGGNRIPSRAGPPPVPEWAARGPQLAVPPPSPFAGVTEDLATSIRQAQQTRMDQALAEQAGRQAQPPLLTDQFAQPPQEMVGAAPQYDPMAAVRWHQAVQAEMQPLIAQEYLMKKMGQPVPKPLADAIKAGNDKLQRGYQPPPENRFVIPAAQEPPPLIAAPPQARAPRTTPQAPLPSPEGPVQAPGGVALAPEAPVPAQVATPPVSTGGAPLVQKPSKIGQSIEAKAVEAKLTKGFSETAGYDPITIADQAQRASDFIKRSPDDARAAIRGDIPLPEGLRGTSLITAMEEELLRTPDAQGAYELANSPLTSATSAAAQEMRLMSERVPDSSSAKFADIKAARKAGAESRGETPAKIKKDISREIVKAASKRQTWEAFVREIDC